ncbi:glycosyltransferase [Paenibacillus kandeliae]|uniref:glycosyltransferase n=1 Tax=Paenibacillus kandeliae TaxID=3231269 RepID=UPI0034599718
MKLISLCMIVKNEEDVLARCLDSIKSIVDEIVIVDTGSTDGTRAIAEQYGANIFEFTWINDFSAAKNEAIRHANGQWILFLDADEYFRGNDALELRNYLSQQQPQPNVVFNLPVINYTGSAKENHIMESSADRVFPNHMNIWYERPIHEQIVSRQPNTQLYNFKLPYRIHHSGYLHETLEKKNKHERNMQIFNDYEKNNKLEAYDFFTLGNEYYATQNYARAIEYFQQAIQQAESVKVAWYPHALIALINTYYHSGRLNDSWKLIEDKLVLFKEYPEYYTFRGIHYEWFGHFDEAKQAYQQAIQVAEKKAAQHPTFWIYSPSMGFDIPIERLGDIALRYGEAQTYISWSLKLLAQNNENIALLIRTLEQISLVDSAEGIISLLRGFYDDQNMYHVTLLFEASLAIANIEMARHFLALLGPDYQLSVQQQLRLALISKEEPALTQALQAAEQEQNRSLGLNKQWILAALSQRDLQLLQLVDAGTTDAAIWKRIAERLLTEDSSTTDSDTTASTDNEATDEDTENEQLFLLAKDLFLLKQFDAFDQLVNRFPQPGLVNMLANYFYTRDCKDIAFNYYSLLLSKQQLDVISLENLAFYHIQENLPDEAVEFLVEALRLDPNRIYLYAVIIRYANGEVKQHYIQQFKERFGKLTSVPFLRL